jgi:hypothetical protein
MKVFLQSNFSSVPALIPLVRVSLYCYFNRFLQCRHIPTTFIISYYWV